MRCDKWNMQSESLNENHGHSIYWELNGKIATGGQWDTHTHTQTLLCSHFQWAFLYLKLALRDPNQHWVKETKLGGQQEIGLVLLSTLFSFISWKNYIQRFIRRRFGRHQTEPNRMASEIWIYLDLILNLNLDRGELDSLSSAQLSSVNISSPQLSTSLLLTYSTALVILLLLYEPERLKDLSQSQAKMLYSKIIWKIRKDERSPWDLSSSSYSYSYSYTWIYLQNINIRMRSSSSSSPPAYPL